ncbi:hypothetical protein BKA70DRAFT_1287038 [Coprinopsis sp. MPI-PUGE-AT-0042]|nr:hypothetical protein BKA70DRAFT_1287038 [Coprinopsis sp. MPI-PUGE-AT-0042]
MSYSISLDSPLSLYSIPVVWLVWVTAIQKAIGYNNVQPRSNVTRVLDTSKKISPEVSRRIQRMEGAHMNGNEVLPLWIGGRNFAGLDNRTLNIAALAFIGLRVAGSASWLRSLVFNAASLVHLTLFVKSGNALLALAKAKALA